MLYVDITILHVNIFNLHVDLFDKKRIPFTQGAGAAENSTKCVQSMPFYFCVLI